MAAEYEIGDEIQPFVSGSLYRGVRKADGLPVVIKRYRSDRSEEQSAVLREYEMLRSLDIRGVASARELVEHRDATDLVMDLVPGQSLRRLMAMGGLSLEECLDLGAQLAAALSELHAESIVHQHICPEHIFWDADLAQITLCGFARAAPLSPQVGRTAPTDDLAYIAPEQTGKTSQAIDPRTDLYALGVVLYEMLAGEHPFAAADPSELVHSHLAREPIPLCDVNKEIPGVLSRMVMKLVKKNAGDRYQSARGLQADLLRALECLQPSVVIADFEIGQADRPGHLQISDTLYGRQLELEALLDACAAVRSGRSLLALVAGYSGVGKTSLIDQVRRPLVAAGGFFVSGKFDQFANQPYTALVQAFRELVGKLLAESDAEVARWQRVVQRALGANGQVIIDMIPEVAQIVGAQPPVPELAPEATQTRLHLVFQDFVGAFVAKDQPLVLFVDDLQWADAPSIDLLRDLVAHAGLEGLLILGAYRDNEVAQEHPLMVARRALEESGAEVRTIKLEPLDAGLLRELVCAALAQETAEMREVADLIYGKTSGNPFYAKTLLRSLCETELLRYSSDTGNWQGNIAAIAELDVAENVAEFLAASLRYFPAAQRRTLQYAACIGNRFDLHVVAGAQERSEAEVESDLDEAISLGLVSLSEDMAPGAETCTAYRFLHDRVQEAANQMLSASERETCHLNIGRQLRAAAERENALDEQIIDIVQHLNRGIAQMVAADELAGLVRLNLAAARRAQAAAAFAPAYEFYKMGIGLLASDGWERDYAVALALYEEGARAAYLCGDNAQREHYVEVVMQRAQSDLDKVAAYEVNILALVAENKIQEAIKACLDVLAILGVEISEAPAPEVVEQKNSAVLALIRGKSNEQILAQPLLQDPAKEAILRILNVGISPAIMNGHPATLLLLATHVHISLTSGHSLHSCVGYAFYGLVFAGLPDYMDISNRLGELAQVLVEELDARENRPRVDVPVYAFIQPWSKHLADMLQPLRASIAAAKGVGDLEFAGRMMNFYSTFAILTGQELTVLEREVSADSEFLARHNMTAVLHWNSIWHQCTLSLLGRTQVPHLLAGAAYDEMQSLAAEIEAGNRNVIYLIYLFKSYLCYLHGEYEQAVEYVTEAAPYIDGVPGMIFMSYLPYFESLALLAVYEQRAADEQQRILDTVEANLQKLNMWAGFAPMNQQHKIYLVEAERARVRGQDSGAAALYDRAIEQAETQGYINDAALANERAALFFAARGREKFAQIYLQDAYRLYVAWGAKAKTDELARRYPQWVDLRLPASAQQPVERLDVEAIVRASQTFSEVKIAGDMLQRMMKIAMENAGAERGVLLLQKRGRWYVEAEATVDAVEVLQSIPITLGQESAQDAPVSSGIVQYVARTQSAVVLEEATQDPRFEGDRYVVERGIRSVLCLPILHQGELSALLYLENNLIRGAFTAERLQILHLLASQFAVALSNALQYDEQLQQFQYLYRLRLSLGQMQSAQELIERVGLAVMEALMMPTTGVRIECDGRVWTQGAVERDGQFVYVRPLHWGGRERGQLLVCCGVQLSSLQESTLLDETAGQLVQALEARELEAQLLQSARLVSMGELAANVAHELNQPLAAISTTAGDVQMRMVEGVPLASEELQAMMADVVEWSQRLGETVDHLRVFSRDTADEPGVAFSLNDAVQASLRLIGTQLASRKIELHLALDEALPDVEGHPRQMEQVLINLLANGRDAVEGQAEKKIWIATYKRDGQAVLEVRDSGCGIEAADVARVFDPFFTTKGAEQGTGLGLSISHAIVREHGGEIRCESRAGAGAVFRVELPLGSDLSEGVDR